MKSISNFFLFSVAVAAAYSVSAIADDHKGHGSAHAATMQLAAGSIEMTEGEVRKIDKENKKITLKHGAIKNLEMPGMTMVFRVRNPAMLDKVQAGDKVKFTAENSDGVLVVTEIQPAK